MRSTVKGSGQGFVIVACVRVYHHGSGFITMGQGQGFSSWVRVYHHGSGFFTKSLCIHSFLGMLDTVPAAHFDTLSTPAHAHRNRFHPNL